MADKKKKTKAKSYLSVELFAMAFALLSALSFICLVTGDALFGDLGLVVRKFFLGVAGYMSFPLLIGGIYLGVKGVIGFKAKKSVMAVGIYALLYVFFIVTILQTAMTQMASIEFSEYLSQCYQGGVGFASATPGGVLFALPAYPLHMWLSNIGVYIICALALVLLTVFLFRTPISNMFANSGKARAERKTANAEKIAKTAQKTPVEPATETAAADGGVSTDASTMPSRSAFGINGDFKLKSEKEKQDKEKEYSLKLLFGDGSSKNGGRSSYADSYDEDFAEKVDYIRRPYEMRGIKVESPMGDTARRVPYEPEDDGIDMNVSAPDSNVYVIRNEGGRSGGRIDAFDEASGRRGGSDTSGTDDYNRDRFTRPERHATQYGRDEHMDENYSPSYDSDTENGIDDASDYGRSAPRGDYSRGGRDNYGRDDYGGRERSSVYEEREENDDMPRGGIRGGSDRGYNETDGETERRSSRSASAEERRTATSSYPFDYDEEEEGNTPNAAVLRKLNNTSGRTDDRCHGDDPTDKENLSASETEIRSARTGDYDGVERGEERYRRNPAAYSGDATHAETTTESSSYARPTDDGVRRPYGESTGTAENDGAYDAGGSARGESMLTSTSAAKTAESMAANQATAAPRTGTQTSMHSDEEKDNPIDNIPKSYRFNYPPLNLLKDYKPDMALQAKITKEQNARKETILQILNNPDIEARICGIKVGPSLTRFEIQIPPRIQMRKVMEKYDDLNLWMEAKSRIRIIAPIPGTSRIGLEVPNSELSPVGLKEIMSSNEFKNAKKNSISFALGKDMVGNPLVTDIAKMPHLLVAGATGTGKSVFLNTLLVSLIYKYSPEDLRIVLVDPKLVEFSVYRGIPELLFGEIFTEEKEASAMLDWMVGEMERRYLKFRDAMVRDINEYNDYITQVKGKKMFRILIIIDEFADLMAVSDKKHMDVAIGRLAAKARSAGIHIILATQRPTTDIVDGSIKTNFPSRIVFKMSSQTDAMVVMGEAGAEKLLGDGDMFYKVGKMTNIERAQGSFINAEEVNNVCKYVRENNKNYYDECALEEIKKLGEESEVEMDADDVDTSGAASGEGARPIRPTTVEDSYIKEAMRIAIQGNNVSISLLQRRLGVGYPKAGKIIDALEAKGYISSVGDNNKRRILMNAEQFEEIFGEPL